MVAAGEPGRFRIVLLLTVLAGAAGAGAAPTPDAAAKNPAVPDAVAQAARVM